MGNDNKYISLKENNVGISLSNYESLPQNSKGIKIADDMPNGTALEVFDEDTGKITIYAEAINELWFER